MKGLIKISFCLYFSFLWLSCSSDTGSTRYTKEQFDHLLDSTVNSKVAIIKKEMEADYEMRKPIIYKSIADSINGNTLTTAPIEIPVDTPINILENE